MDLPILLEWFNHYYISSAFVKLFVLPAKNGFGIVQDAE